MGREHWVQTKFETLGTFINGRAFKPTEWGKSGLPIIRIQNLNNSISYYNYCDFEVPAKYHVHDGDLLFAWSGTPGTSFGAHTWNGGHAVLNQHIFRIEERSDVIDKKFFMYLINSNLNEHIAAAHGTAGLAHITKAKFEESEVSIPSLSEQKCIVEKLDAILPKVKNAKARLEKIPLILQKFRQSLLSAACSGRLTEDWREGKDLPEWEETSIRNIAVSMSTGPFGSMLHSYDYIENGIPVINPTHIAADQIIPDNSITLSQEKADELSRYRLKRNDILLARRGDLSKCGIVTEKEVNWIAGTGLFILRTHVNPLFFKYIFGTDDVQNLLNNNSIGSTMLNLNQTILGNIEILLPPLEEQQEIVRRVEKLFVLANSLETKYKKAIQRVEKIEQSVLAKAFKGELTDPNPNDEPAAELLNRIHKEKAKLETTKKPGSKQSGKTEIAVA